MSRPITRGDLVRVGLAYQGGGHHGPDGSEGIYTVVRVLPGGLTGGGRYQVGPDALLVRGDYRHDLPDAGDWDLAVTIGRCEVLADLDGTPAPIGGAS